MLDSATGALLPFIPDSGPSIVLWRQERKMESYLSNRQPFLCSFACTLLFSSLGRIVEPGRGKIMNLWRLAESFRRGDHLLDVLESGNSSKFFYLSFQGPADFAFTNIPSRVRVSSLDPWDTQTAHSLTQSHFIYILGQKNFQPFVGP